MIQVAVSNRQRSVRVSTARAKRNARRVLLEMGFVKAELSLAFVDDGEMRLLNATYRRANEATDVLAFAMGEGRFSSVNPHVLGDVVISTETAAFQAKKGGRNLSEELDVLLVHGILHLIGYDHERSPSEARVMRAKEESLRRLLESLG
jgi:probable rRNA maturation factor